MSTMRLNISENPVIVVHVESIISFEVPGLLRLLELLIVAFHHLLVLELSVSGHRRHLVFGLHELLVDYVVLLLACALELIAELLVALLLEPLVDLIPPGSVGALIGEQVVVGDGELHGEEDVRELLLVGLRVVHERVRDAELLGVDARQGGTREGQEGAEFARETREVEGGAAVGDEAEGGLVEGQLGVQGHSRVACGLQEGCTGVVGVAWRYTDDRLVYL